MDDKPLQLRERVENIVEVLIMNKLLQSSNAFRSPIPHYSRRPIVDDKPLDLRESLENIMAVLIMNKILLIYNEPNILAMTEEISEGGVEKF